MAAATLQRNFPTLKQRDKAFIIEMNETPMEGPTFHESFQPLEISYLQSQLQGSNQLQGSVISLASKSCIDHSDVQPLTEVHSCRYDECMKYHHTKTDKERDESPLSPLKNVLLYLVLTLFVLWIVVYTVLSQLKVF